MALRLIQNTSTHNPGKAINIYLINVPCKKKKHFSINFDKSLFVVIKVNNILKTTKLLGT
jgi:hypothetical protein